MFTSKKMALSPKPWVQVQELPLAVSQVQVLEKVKAK